jgi:DNA-binding transcriptional MocR family regulator
MSFQAVAWAIEVRVGDPILKNLLMAICHHADRENWSCWPSQDLLAYETEVSKRTIQRKLEELEERGFIRIEKRRNLDGTQANSILTVTGGQAVTLQPPVDKNGLTGGQKPGVPGDNTCPPVKKQEEQEEQSLFAPLPKKKRQTIPKTYPMTDSHKKYATDRGLAETYAQNVFENFKNHHTAKGTLMLDWDAAWRTWVGNEIKFSRRPPPAGRPPDQPGRVYGDDYM